jgi:large subunit ribosomal protein L17
MSMLRGLVTAAIENERLETTVTRAKETSALIEKMITLGKEGTLAARRNAMSFITKEDMVKKLFEELAPRFAGRSGGYTRVTRIGPRRGDAAEMAVLEILGE